MFHSASIRATFIVVYGLVASLALCTNATAATATFLSPSQISETEVSALSTSGDNSGFFLSESSVLTIVLDTPFATTRADNNISIFTLAPPSGTALVTVSFGSFNNGSPQIVRSRQVQAGSSVDVGNLFQRGCGVLGGCDYIEIVTTRTRRGAEGATIDYIEVNGEVVEVSAPTPEPATWLLMIIAFSFVAARAKHQKYNPAGVRFSLFQKQHFASP